jgi:hypothetical protein
MRLSAGLVAVFSAAMLPPAGWGQANPADFPVKVHVVWSRTVVLQGTAATQPEQHLEAEIDGQQVELEGYSEGVLAPGDDRARISAAVHARNKNPNTYDVYRGYDFLMPDGKIRLYAVMGLGPKEAQP